jgi:choline dehydrogenase-like flavoprotein
MKSVNWAYPAGGGPVDRRPQHLRAARQDARRSSSINGHIYNRGQRQDFDTWAQLGNRGWGYPDVLPYFKRMEARSARATRPIAGARAASPSPPWTGTIRSARPSWKAP